MKVRCLEVEVEGRGSGASDDRLIPLEQVDIDEAKAEVRLRTLPSSAIPELPPFTGLPVAATYEARVQAVCEASSSNSRRM